MERAESGSDSDGDGAESTVAGGKKFGTKPYLDKEGREILNRAARELYRENPDWCDSPDDPSTSDVLVQLQQGNDGFTDTALIIELLGKGLSAQETLVWILYQHSDLEPREIFYAHEGKNHPGRSGVDDQAVRNIKSRIRSAGMKLGVDADV